MPSSDGSTPAPPEVSSQITGVLRSLVAERYPYLGEHVNKVARMAERVAPRLGHSGEARSSLVQAAYLHDIGKLAIPERILRKAEPLDETETEIMRRHTIVGAEILAAAGIHALTISFVRSSHEWMDGSGYPDGLLGEEIPLGARIIAVCDAYDAMTSPRPYRPVPMSADEARSELARCSGTQFDPAVVAATGAAQVDAEQV